MRGIGPAGYLSLSSISGQVAQDFVIGSV